MGSSSWSLSKSPSLTRRRTRRLQATCGGACSHPRARARPHAPELGRSAAPAGGLTPRDTPQRGCTHPREGADGNHREQDSLLVSRAATRSARICVRRTHRGRRGGLAHPPRRFGRWWRGRNRSVLPRDVSRLASLEHTPSERDVGLDPLLEGVRRALVYPELGLPWWRNRHPCWLDASLHLELSNSVQ